MRVRNLSYIRTQDPKMAETFDDIVSGVDNVAALSNVSSQGGNITQPTNVGRVSVIAADGVFDIRIFDASPVTRGINYFVEYSTTPQFTNAIPIDLGTSRCHRCFLGNQTLYWRAYSQYIGSAPSDPVYFGISFAPTAVVGGGSLVGPTPQASTGSGTASSDGTQSGQGFGLSQTRS
jgi:hypothetical protein